MSLSNELQLWLAACIPGLAAAVWLIWKTYQRRRDAILVNESERYIWATTWVLLCNGMVGLFWLMYVAVGVVSSLDFRPPAPPLTRLGAVAIDLLIGGVFLLAVWTIGSVVWIIYQEHHASK